jgi:hypothetical protein
MKKENTNTNYRMKPEAAVYYREQNITVTQANLTDELASAMLADHPNYASHFDYIPEQATAPKQASKKSSK